MKTKRMATHMTAIADPVIVPLATSLHTVLLSLFNPDSDAADDDGECSNDWQDDDAYDMLAKVASEHGHGNGKLVPTNDASSIA